MITREWLAQQLKSLRGEHSRALGRWEAAHSEKVRAEKEYCEAVHAVNTLEECIRGLAAELNLRKDEA
jgi:hypothetical protein